MSLTAYDLCGPDPCPMTRSEVDALKSLCALLPPLPVIVQIGAERGVSTLAMLEARPDAFVFSVDTGEAIGEKQNAQSGGHDVRRIVRGLGRSQDIGAFWPMQWQCHLLYVDGDHRYEAVCEDIRLWRARIYMGGVIAFHDYIPEPIPPHIHGRVVYAVDELMKGYEEILWQQRLKAFRIP